VTKGGWVRVQERVAARLGGIVIEKGHMVDGKLGEIRVSSTILICVYRVYFSDALGYLFVPQHLGAVPADQIDSSGCRFAALCRRDI
jgi:hypothetical protein